MQRKTAANEQNKVHKLLFSIYLSSGILTKRVFRSCQAIIICKKLPVAGSVGYKLPYNSSRWAAGRVKINSVPTPSVLMTLIFSSCA